MRFFDQQNILSDMQHGFRKSRSCESQLILTIQDLAKGIDDNTQIDAVLLDFSKSFDKVPHKRLASKLHHYGIRGRTLSWIQSFLANRTQRVAVEGVMSDSAPVTSGVPQGTVLGPLLFLVYINDLPAQVKSKARLFADDCLLYRKICSPDDRAALQRDLDSLQRWERDWLMARQMRGHTNYKKEENYPGVIHHTRPSPESDQQGQVLGCHNIKQPELEPPHRSGV